MKGITSLAFFSLFIGLAFSAAKIETKTREDVPNDQIQNMIRNLEKETPMKSHPNFATDEGTGLLTKEELDIIRNKLSHLTDDQIQGFIKKLDTMDTDNLKEFIADIPKTQSVAEKSLFRRTCWCDLKWGPYNNPNDVKDMYQMYHFDPVQKSILFDLTCRDMLRECRSFCMDYAQDFFHQTVPVISDAGGIRACHHFSSTILRTNSRHIFLTYKADHCQDTVHEYLGEVCCWKCNTGERIRYNHGCINNPPNDCELYVR